MKPNLQELIQQLTLSQKTDAAKNNGTYGVLSPAWGAELCREGVDGHTTKTLSELQEVIETPSHFAGRYGGADGKLNHIAIASDVGRLAINAITRLNCYPLTAEKDGELVQTAAGKVLKKLVNAVAAAKAELPDYDIRHDYRDKGRLQEKLENISSRNTRAGIGGRSF